MKLQREEVAKQMAMKTNKQKSDEEEVEAVSESAGSSSHDEELKVVVGDFVRSTFGDDGVDYEAEVMSVNENGTCLIRYIGYGNEERIKMENLVASWGPEARHEQALLAEADQQVSSDKDDNQEELHKFVLNKSQGFRNSLPIPPMVSKQLHQFSCSLFISYLIISATDAARNVRQHSRLRIHVCHAHVLVHVRLLHWFISR